MLRRGAKVAIVVLVCAAVAVAALSYHNYAYVYRKTHEPATDATATSTNSVYSDEEFKSTLEGYGFGGAFDLDRVVAQSYVIPGLYATKTLSGDKDPAVCSSMVPQGVCEAEGYVLVSAYCASKKHNSVVYVIDKDSHEFVKEVVLRGTPHVGGIAFDPKARNVWLCGYNDQTKVAYANVLPLADIESYSLDESSAPCDYSNSYPVYTMERTSFIDYYDESLYIGNFVGDQDDISTVQIFPLGDDGKPYTLGSLRDFLKNGLTEDGRRQLRGYLRGDVDEVTSDRGLGDDALVPADVTFINGKTQGFTVDKTYSALSQSSGPADSKLYVFQNEDNVFDSLRTTDNAIDSFTLPPMLEQITISGNRLYLCFESGAYAYRARLNPKIDRIVVLERES